jgi:hypothetical protein
MKLEITNIGWPTIPSMNDSVIKDLYKLYRTKIPEKLNVNCKIFMQDNKIIFDTVHTKGEYKYLFSSMVENRFPLQDGSPLIKEKGRNYLNTDRLTEEQWNGTVNLIVKSLDDLKLNADINMYQEDKVINLRNKTVNTTWPKPGKFSVKG